MKRSERRCRIKRRRRIERRQRIWSKIKAIIFPWPNLAYIIRRNRAVFAVVAGLILSVTVASLYSGYSYEQGTESTSISDQSHSKSKQGVPALNPHRLTELADASVSSSDGEDNSDSEPGSSEISDPTETPPSTSPPDPPPDTEPPDTSPPDNSVRVTDVIFTDEKGEGTIPDGKTSFSATSAYSVYILPTWKNIEGSHDQVIEVYCPDGELYQTIYVLFTTYSLPSMTKTVPWSPRPVEIELISMTNGVYPVWAELPIAGTWAMRLTGTWSVKIYLDDNDTCFAQSTFTLNP